MAVIQDLKTAISFRKQTALGTAVANAAQYFSFFQRNRDVPAVDPNTETNRGEIGVGSAFPTTIYKLNRIVNHPIEVIANTELAALFFGMALGTVVKSAEGSGWKYVCTPFSSLEAVLATLSMHVGLGAGTGSEIFDDMLIGLAIEEIALELSSSIQVDNLKLIAQLVGSGKVTPNSGFVAPAVNDFNFLNAGSAVTLTLAGFDYLASAQLNSLRFAYKNNIKTDKNYRPGAGASQDGFFLMSRMLRGAPEVTLTAQIEIVAGSSEQAAFLASTSGALDLRFDGALLGAGPEKHYIRIQAPDVIISRLKPAEDSDIVVYDIEFAIKQPTGGGAPVTVTVATDVDTICSVAA